MRLAVAFLLGAAAAFAQPYVLGPDSQPKNLPHGTTTKYTFAQSKVFPGTTRDYWVYVPAQYDPAKHAALMVFFDGGGFANATGSWRVPVVFDNLIAAKEMPVTVAVMVNPGVLPARSSQEQSRYNRAYEYDGLGDSNARFVIDELLPEVQKLVNLSANPDDRGVAGSSSGGIAAFTAAWNRPDSFHRVLSFIGSYTDLKGGDLYVSLIRKREPLPLRVFLEDGDHDQSIYSGNWYLANQSMYSALQFAGYEATFSVGTQAHSGSHGASILPDALRWLWKGYPAPIVKSYSTAGNRHFVSEILDPASDWKEVSSGHQFTEGPAIDKNGELYFADTRAGIYKIGGTFLAEAHHTSGLMFGPDGKLYAAEQTGKRVVAYNVAYNVAYDVTAPGKETVVTEGVVPNDLCVSSKGDIYFTEPSTHRVYLVKNGKRQVVYEGITYPNGVRLSPDESLLVVADSASRSVWSFQVLADGTLANGEPFYRLVLPDEGAMKANADGMAFDVQGFLYVATYQGIQICDQAGRVVAIIDKPSAATPSNVVIGGPDMQTLYVTAGDKVFARHLRRKGFHPWQPVKPAMPQL